MKKIVLLLMLQYSLLLSADFVFLNNGKIASITNQSTPTTPGSTSGVTRNSVSQIWADMNTVNGVHPSGMRSTMPQFKGPVFKSVSELLPHKYANIWLEIESLGNGTNCSRTVNSQIYAKNTKIEVGTIYFFIKRNNVWTLAESNKNNHVARRAGMMPFNNPYPRQCQNIYAGQKMPITTSSEGFDLTQPINHTRYHAWTLGHLMPPQNTIQAIYGFVYLRKKLINPNLPDNAKYVAHMSSDLRNSLSLPPIGASGVSRYKEIKTEWTPFNFMTKMTKAQLEANPPPLSLLKP